ncbi:hypothetical protein ACIOWI_33295 [Streptomyces sp. NPDC087659]|uniref:hypothetical protein n=1 Tax=Streptomyces sp. NPDC087659 TaxID=3365801 RepID=UPI003810A5A5
MDRSGVGGPNTPAADGATGAATPGMALVVSAVHGRLIGLLLGAAVLAGAGQGIGQLGGFSLLGARADAARLAELLPVGSGYPGDAAGIGFSATLPGLVVAASASAGGVYITCAGRSRPSTERH